MKSGNLRCLRSMIIQSVGFGCLSVGTFLGLAFLYVEHALIIGLIMIVFDLIFLAIFDKKRPYAIAGFVGMFSTGVMMGGFLSDYGLKVDTILFSLLITFAAVAVVHGIILLFRLHRIVLGLIVFLLFASTIMLFSTFNTPLIKMLAFLSTNLFCIEIGLLISIGKHKPVDRYLTGGMLWAFAIVFVIIIIVVSEGEVLSGLDCLDFGPGSRKKKKR